MEKEVSNRDLAVLIEDLARMTAEGFSDVNTRFDVLTVRVDGVEERIGSLEKEVRSTNQHIDRVIMPMLDSHAHRIKGLEVKLA